MDAIARLLALGNRLQQHGVTTRVRVASSDVPPISTADDPSADHEGAWNGSGDVLRGRGPWLLQALMHDGRGGRVHDQRELMARITAAFLHAHGRGAGSVAPRAIAPGTEPPGLTTASGPVIVPAAAEPAILATSAPPDAAASATTTAHRAKPPVRTPAAPPAEPPAGPPIQPPAAPLAEGSGQGNAPSPQAGGPPTSGNDESGGPGSPAGGDPPVDVRDRLTPFVRRRVDDPRTVQWLTAVLREIQRTHQRR